MPVAETHWTVAQTLVVPVTGAIVALASPCLLLICVHHGRRLPHLLHWCIRWRLGRVLVLTVYASVPLILSDWRNRIFLHAIYTDFTMLLTLMLHSMQRPVPSPSVDGCDAIDPHGQSSLCSSKMQQRLLCILHLLVLMINLGGFGIKDSIFTGIVPLSFTCTPPRHAFSWCNETWIGVQAFCALVLVLMQGVVLLIHLSTKMERLTLIPFMSSQRSAHSGGPHSIHTDLGDNDGFHLEY